MFDDEATLDRSHTTALQFLGLSAAVFAVVVGAAFGIERQEAVRTYVAPVVQSQTAAEELPNPALDWGSFMVRYDRLMNERAKN